MSIQLPDGYGYVFLVLGLSHILLVGLGINVGAARRKYDIQYPTMYAPPDHKHAKEFNCCQRSHQQVLEEYGFVMISMVLCGFVYPTSSALFGFIWVAGKAIYGYCYSKYGPSGRYFGAISHFGDLPLFITCLRIAYEKINK